jgi:hypothetical protein
MPLVPTAYAATDTSEDISFLMLDGETPVRVDVPRDLLMSIARSGRGPSKGCMATFEERRGDIEQVASAKYDAGDYRRYANSRVVPLRAADWQQRHPK